MLVRETETAIDTAPSGATSNIRTRNSTVDKPPVSGKGYRTAAIRPALQFADGDQPKLKIDLVAAPIKSAIGSAVSPIVAAFGLVGTLVSAT
jgi:hypothetical protein